MTKLILLLIAAVFLAYQSEKYTNHARRMGQRYCISRDVAYVALVIMLSMFAGLRTNYNDTGNYIYSYNNAVPLGEWISNPNNLNIFKNPAYYAYESLLKTVHADSQVLIFTTAVFTQVCYLLFFKRYSRHFTFTIFLYMTLGTYVLTLAAIKQVLGMAILTLAFPYLEKKQFGRYYVVVFVAMLFHTYAIAFAVLPLFASRPWKSFTYLFILVLVAVLMNFTEVITEFMEQANDLGKTLAEYEVFDNNTINLFRLAVYAVVPLMSWLFQRLVFRNADRMDNILVHMSIISLACMTMGTQSGANMFGRMANYFELGTICVLPWMLDQIFEKRSAKLVSTFAVICYMGFFIYAYGINICFDQEYQATTLWKFLVSLF